MMLEVIIVVLIVLFSLSIVFVYNAGLPKNIIAEKEQLLLINKDKLRVTEKKFLQGKIKEPVFFQLKEKLEIEIVLIELEIFRLNKTGFIFVEEKLKKLLNKLKKPTKFKKAKLKSLLSDLEFIKKEMDFVEKRLLKKEIMNSSFEKLIQQKENEMIEKEIQIVHFMQEIEK